MKIDMESLGIKVLTAVEAIRKRPGIYVGPLDDPKALTALIIEAMSPGLANAENKLVSRIDVIVHGNEVIVSDNGPGIPTNELEATLTQLRTGNPYASSSNFITKGLVFVNALSEFFRVGNRVNKKLYLIDYKKGELDSPLTCDSNVDYNGTTFNFKVDKEIFGDLKIDTIDLATEINKIKAETRATINLIIE